MPALSEGSVSANGVDFAYLAAGPADDRQRPLALCLHGFPDSAHGWRHLLPALADSGFRAIAPFQRGYAPSSIPADGCYQTGALAADANALHEVLGGDGRAVIIGHDWGAAGTHGAAVLAPQRWSKVVTMAVPPGPALGMAFLGNLAQVQRSWYMFFFQHALADFVVSANDLAFIDLLWAQWSPGHDATDDLAFTKAALRDPAHLAAAIGYYRAALGDGYKDPTLDAAQAATQGWATQPHLYLHGRDDGCIGAELAEATATMAPANVTVELVEHAGHFLHLERPDVVGNRIVSFLR
jgi:pimeloyl-ACP methyl ester carboxylesterase